MPGINTSSSSSSNRSQSHSQQQIPQQQQQQQQQQAYVTRLNDQTIVVNLPRTSMSSTSSSSSTFSPLHPSGQSTMITPPAQMQPLSSSPVLIYHGQQQSHQESYDQNGRPRRVSLVASDSQLGGPLPLNSHQYLQQTTTATTPQFPSPSSSSRESPSSFSNSTHSSYQSTHAVSNSNVSSSSATNHGNGSRVQYRAGHSTTQYPSSPHQQYMPQQYPQQQQQPYRLQPIAPAPGPPGPDNFAAQQSRQQAQQQHMQQQQYQQQQPRQYQYQPQQQQHTNNNNAPLSIPQQLQQPFPSSSTSSTSSAPSLHPQFQAKAVCRLTCKSCLTDVCMRGMRAILLADTRVELYSTDRPPAGVQLVYDDYRTRNCKCRIRDVACLGCGNTLGYHVTQPCEKCLSACNNGHFWMFHSDGVSCTERYLPKTSAAYARTIQATRDGSSSEASSSRRSSLASSSSSSSSSATAISGTESRRGSTGAEEAEPDLSFRRRTSIHDIEYNNAVHAGPHTFRSTTAATSAHRASEGRGRQENHGGNGEDEDSEREDYEEDRDSETEEDEEGDDEENEEKPVLMLWAALHAQEERYLQQMQQQLVLQQQQQQQIQQRLQLLQEQQQQRELQERTNTSSTDINAVAMTTGRVPPSTAPTVGSRYHNMISTAISNASMTLWDESHATNQYEQVCR